MQVIARTEERSAGAEWQGLSAAGARAPARVTPRTDPSYHHCTTAVSPNPANFSSLKTECNLRSILTFMATLLRKPWQVNHSHAHFSQRTPWLRATVLVWCAMRCDASPSPFPIGRDGRAGLVVRDGGGSKQRRRIDEQRAPLRHCGTGL